MLHGRQVDLVVSLTGEQHHRHAGLLRGPFAHQIQAGMITKIIIYQVKVVIMLLAGLQCGRQIGNPIEVVVNVLLVCRHMA